jgi:hypothetical protein
MVDWHSLHDAYGDASDVPGWLQQLSADPTDEVWHELWSRLCHQGTVYSASFAALPILLGWAQTLLPGQRSMVLALAGAIIVSDDVVSGVESRPKALAETAPGFEKLALEELAQPDLGQSDFLCLAQAVLATRGERLWGTKLDHLDSGEFPGECTSCGTDLYLAVGEHGFFATAEEWLERDSGPQTPIVPAAAQSLSGVQRWLHEQALTAGLARVAEWLLYAFGSTSCPRCQAQLSVAGAVERACGPTRR